MSDFQSTASAEVQERAEKMGWIPPARFKGDPERFIDADEYIERGETVLPIVKEHNRRLEAELAQVRQDAAATAAALKAAQLAIEQIEERHTVATQKAVENARAQVKAQLAAASEAGDYEGVAELTDQLTQLKTAEAVAKAEPVQAPPPAPAAFVPPPEMVEWNNENPWFGKDKRKTALALGIAQELREAGESATGRRFFDLVKDEMEKTLGAPAVQATSKVEGARNGFGSAKGNGKGYDVLPADAKAACEADTKRFVGPGKRYKSVAEWRTRYAELYFEA